VGAHASRAKLSSTIQALSPTSDSHLTEITGLSPVVDARPEAAKFMPCELEM